MAKHLKALVQQYIAGKSIQVPSAFIQRLDQTWSCWSLVALHSSPYQLLCVAIFSVTFIIYEP